MNSTELKFPSNKTLRNKRSKNTHVNENCIALFLFTRIFDVRYAHFIRSNTKDQKKNEKHNAAKEIYRISVFFPTLPSLKENL